ncbi:hypothetical protein ABPG77_007076 [Micractinium sp. CCAP 211/92]
MGATPRHGGQHAPATVYVDARLAPPPKPSNADRWTDDEEAAKSAHQQGHSFCTRFRFGVWLSVVVLLIAAVVGLSVTMALLSDGKGGNAPSQSDPEGGGSGNGGTSGTGNTGPLPVPSAPPFTVPKNNKAIWWDEFDGDSLDDCKWSYDLGSGDWGWGNNESEVYTKDNVQVADGHLYLTAQYDGKTYTSGRINTKSTASFWPGMQLEDGTSFKAVHIEARMRLPEPGQGLWPAFWMFPTELTYGKWAASGEIDILESINDMVTATQGIHFGGPDPQNVESMVRTRQADNSPYSDGFHTFAVDWSLNQITVSVDGEAAQTFVPREADPEGGWWTAATNAPQGAPFNKPFYIIMNLAVGGLWPKYPDSSTPFPATLAVDYVRVWGQPA